MNDDEYDRDETEHEDPDWQAEAQQGERAEFFARVNAIATRIRNSTPLDVTKRPPRTRLVVHPVPREEGHPEPEIPVEFNLVDPASLKVLVTDPMSFPEPTEAILLGSGDADGAVIAPGQLRRLDWLIYEVGGKKYVPHNNTIDRVVIYAPGMTEPSFTLWDDC